MIRNVIQSLRENKLLNFRGNTFVLIGGNKITYVFFDKDQPTFVLKILKNTTLTEKQMFFQKLIRKNPIIKNSIPRVIYKNKANGKVFLVENYMKGKRMIPRCNTMDIDFKHIVNWIKTVNSLHNRKMDENEIRMWLKEIDTARKRVPLRKDFIDKLVVFVKSNFREQRLFIANGDLAYSNVLINQKSVNILELDEYAENIPLYDFFSFAFSYYTYLKTTHQLRKKFIEFIIELKEKDYVRDYLEIIQAQNDFYPLLALFLIDHFSTKFFSGIQNTIPNEALGNHKEALMNLQKVLLQSEINR